MYKGHVWDKLRKVEKIFLRMLNYKKNLKVSKKIKFPT